MSTIPLNDSLQLTDMRPAGAPKQLQTNDGSDPARPFSTELDNMASSGSLGGDEVQTDIGQASEISLDVPMVIDGEEFERLGSSEYRQFLGETGIVLPDTKPEIANLEVPDGDSLLQLSKSGSSGEAKPTGFEAEVIATVENSKLPPQVRPDDLASNSSATTAPSDEAVVNIGPSVAPSARLDKAENGIEVDPVLRAERRGHDAETNMASKNVQTALPNGPVTLPHPDPGKTALIQKIQENSNGISKAIEREASLDDQEVLNRSLSSELNRVDQPRKPTNELPVLASYGTGLVSPSSTGLDPNTILKNEGLTEEIDIARLGDVSQAKDRILGQTGALQNTIQFNGNGARQIMGQLTAGLAQLADGTVEIRLNPAELGRITIHLVESINGIQSASVAVEKPEILDLLRRNENLLSDEFDQAGFGEMSFSFNQQEGEEAEIEPAGQTEATNLILENELEPAPHLQPSLGADLDIRL